MNRMTVSLTVFLSLILLLAGCAATSSMPEDHFYRLSVPAPAKRYGEPTVTDRILVGEMEAYGIYHERAILFSPAGHPNTLKYHHYHHWIDKPAALVREQLIRYLRETGYFAEVFAANDRRRQAVIIQPELKRFERQLNGDGGVDINITLGIRLKGSGSMSDTDYTVVQRAEDGSMSASIRAFNAGLENINQRIADDLRELLNNANTKISKTP